MAMKRNRYIWRLDFSLLGEDNYNSEIGREIKKEIGLYKACLRIGVFCGIFLTFVPLGVSIYYADLTFFILSVSFAFVMCVVFRKVVKAPKISGSELKKIEDELKVQSDEMKEYDAILTENTLIVLQGIMIYRIPYYEISKIRVKWYPMRTGMTYVCYTTRDGSQIETIHQGYNSLKSYYTDHHIPFDPLWEQLLKYNPNIIIEDSKRGSAV